MIQTDRIIAVRRFLPVFFRNDIVRNDSGMYLTGSDEGCWRSFLDYDIVILVIGSENRNRRNKRRAEIKDESK
ncbi:MAG: hypothetical protein Q4C66_16025 [Lachnospiraceae bacterium]|nr:hypothetical protein [Lachnospiraceae bacterium]